MKSTFPQYLGCRNHVSLFQGCDRCTEQYEDNLFHRLCMLVALNIEHKTRSEGLDCYQSPNKLQKTEGALLASPITIFGTFTSKLVNLKLEIH